MRTIVMGSKQWYLYFNAFRNQTPDLVKEKIADFGQLNRCQMTISEALGRFSDFIDPSDPDVSFPNHLHGYQTAESLREMFPKEDWLHLVGLIHDLGKILFTFGEPDWAIVGDIFPVESTPKPETKLDDLVLSWGHDMYLYLVLKNHPQCTLPKIALDIIRYHSFYGWHTEGRFDHLDFEPEVLEWVQTFNRHDLYSKKHSMPIIEDLKDYYQGLIDKYVPGKVKF